MGIYYINRRSKIELTGSHVIIVLAVSGYNEFITDLCSKPFPTTNLCLNSASHGIKKYPMKPQQEASINKYSQPRLTELFNKYLIHTKCQCQEITLKQKRHFSSCLCYKKKKTRKSNISCVSALLDNFFCLGSCTSANLYKEHSRALYRNYTAFCPMQ